MNFELNKLHAIMQVFKAEDVELLQPMDERRPLLPNNPAVTTENDEDQDDEMPIDMTSFLTACAANLVGLNSILY